MSAGIFALTVCDMNIVRGISVINSIEQNNSILAVPDEAVLVKS